MVTRLQSEPTPVYRVHDDDGRPVGEIVDPRGSQVVGRGAGTVLLRRSPSR